MFSRLSSSQSEVHVSLLKPAVSEKPGLGYAGAALMFTLAFMTASKAHARVEESSKIQAAKRTQVSTSLGNRMVRISKGNLVNLQPLPGCGWWQIKDPKDLVVAGWGVTDPRSGWQLLHMFGHLRSQRQKIKSTKIHPDIFAQEKGQECQWYLVLVNNRNYANDKGYTMWIEHDRTQNICHPATSKKLPPGLLDFYGAFSFSPSSLLLNWFGSFFLAFCSSIWLTTGYYGRLAFSKMAWFMGSQREHHPPTVLPCLRLLKGIISKKWFHLQLKWDPTKDQQPRVYESWVEIMWSSFFVNFQPSFRFIQKTCSPFQRREGVPFHLIFSGGFASCSCAENGGIHPPVNAVYFDTESEVSKLRDLDGFGTGVPSERDSYPIVASTSPFCPKFLRRV